MTDHVAFLLMGATTRFAVAKSSHDDLLWADEEASSNRSPSQPATWAHEDDVLAGVHRRHVATRFTRGGLIDPPAALTSFLFPVVVCKKNRAFVAGNSGSVRIDSCAATKGCSRSVVLSVGSGTGDSSRSDDV